MDGEKTKTDRLTAIEAAVMAWDRAPMHVKAMAGTYVGPVIETIKAIGAELDELNKKIEVIEHLSRQLSIQSLGISVEQAKGLKYGDFTL